MVSWVAVSFLLCLGCLQVCQSKGSGNPKFVMFRNQRGLSEGRSVEGKRPARSKNLKRGQKCRKGVGRGRSGTRKRKRGHCKRNRELQKRRRTGRSGVENRKVGRRKTNRKNRHDTLKEKPRKTRYKRKEKHEKQKRSARRPWWLGKGVVQINFNS